MGRNPAPYLPSVSDDGSKDHPGKLCIFTTECCEVSLYSQLEGSSDTQLTGTFSAFTPSAYIISFLIFICLLFYVCTCELTFSLTMKLISEKKPGKCEFVLFCVLLNCEGLDI